MLLAIDRDGRVCSASANISLLPCRDATEAIGRQIADLVGEDLGEQIMAIPEVGHLQLHEPLYVGQFKTNPVQASVIIWAHRHDDRIIVEIEPDDLGQVSASLPLKWMHELQRKMLEANTTHEIAQHLTEILRSTTHYDHIMVYAFDKEWNGEVVGESKSSNIDVSYLGLHFPSTDIPSQARELYRRQLLRIVADSHASGTKVISLAGERPLDMSFATLRSVSPIHLEYVRNMGVRATIVSSILVGEEFWGLIVGHERFVPRVPTLAERAAFQIGATLAGGILAAQQVSQTLQMNRVVEACIDRIVSRLPAAGLARAVTMEYAALADALKLDAMVVQLGGECIADGVPTPPLAPWHDPENLLITDQFSDRFLPDPSDRTSPDQKIVGGCLFRVGSDPTALVLLGRVEHEHVISWGGDPGKHKETTPHSTDAEWSGSSSRTVQRLRPRTSFAAWKELVKGRSQKFSGTELATLELLSQRLTIVLQAESERRRRERASLEERLAALGRIAGGVAHDLNNVLAIIHLNLDLAIAISQEEELKDLLQTSLHAAENGADVTSALLSFARRQQMKPTAVESGSFLKKFGAMAKPLLKGKIKIYVDVKEHDLWCRADPGLLETALLNLATNARDSIDQEGGEVRVSAFSVHSSIPIIGLGNQIPAGDYVAFHVADNGKGMPADVLARAAEPFFTTKPVGSGNGLGLSMVIGFAAQSGGAVFIDSTPGRGTDVRVILPRVIGDASGASVERPNVPKRLLYGIRLLIVEDNESLARGLVATCTREGMLVSHAASVPEAKAALETGTFDLLLCDVMLGITGTAVDVLAILKILGPKIPVILMTGYADTEIPRIEQISGFTLLQKPFSASTIISTFMTEFSAR
jgi:light-regulated signal transduction histidine kinase (bacteriophytochrome)/CheY-like chemotaxis protein